MENTAPTPISPLGKAQREPWVDVVRLLCIICVCIGHCNLGCLFSTSILNQAAVGLFFVLAGYFDKKDNWRLSLKRIGVMFLFYAAWILLHDVVLSPSLSLRDYLLQLLRGEWSLWFIHHLIVCLALSCLFKKLRFAAKLLGLAFLLCLSHPLYPIWDFHIWSIPLAAAFFFFGNIMNSVPLKDVPEQIFPPLPPALAFGLAAAALAAFAALNSQGIHPLPEGIVVLGLMYALLLLGYAGNRLFPRCAHWLALAGPSIILSYALNLGFLRVFISAYIHTIGEGAYPPYWLTALVVAGMIAGCAAAYRLLYGKNRLLDIFLFAR